MREKKYKVIDERGCVLASEMSFNMALVFIKGFVDEYYNERLNLTIKEIIDENKVASETEKWLENL